MHAHTHSHTHARTHVEVKSAIIAFSAAKVKRSKKSKIRADRWRRLLKIHTWGKRERGWEGKKLMRPRKYKEEEFEIFGHDKNSWIRFYCREKI